MGRHLGGLGRNLKRRWLRQRVGRKKTNEVLLKRGGYDKEGETRGVNRYRKLHKKVFLGRESGYGKRGRR